MKGLEDSSQILVTPDLIEGDISKGLSLRPKKFCEFIGQETVLDNVKIMVESAKIRGEALGHILLSGPPGLGKTSLSMILANEIGAGIQVVSGPAIEKKGDLAAILTNLDDRVNYIRYVSKISCLKSITIHIYNLFVNNIFYKFCYNTTFIKGIFTVNI